MLRTALAELGDEDEVTIKVAPQLAERAREVVLAALRDKVVAAPGSIWASSRRRP
ncbi:MAG: hypothetical protein R3F59_25130 [Myxococcota bacterium]